MPPRNQWLLYGATGYTGQRIAEYCIAHGLKPVLAGRRAAPTQELATRLGLEWEHVDLDAPGLPQRLSRYSTVLNCAGPFIHTFRPLLEACLEAATHYVDITGEVAVYEALAAFDAAARDKNVVIMPGAGFDMVPSDCMALALLNEMPDATDLDIGYSLEGTITRGSIRTALGAFVGNNQIRRNHELVSFDRPMMKRFAFGPGAVEANPECYATTFGDLSIAWRTTRIPNVTSYLHVTPSFQKLMATTSEAEILQLPEGADDDELNTVFAYIVGEVRNAAGQTKRARVVTPQVYAATFPLAATIAQLVHDGIDHNGFVTPARAFGPDFILGFDRFRFEWLSD